MKHLKLFEEFVFEAKYNSWVMPDSKMLAQEFKVEHELKSKNLFDSEEEFIDAVKSGDIVEITPKMDMKISNRSRTETFDDLHNLIKGYASYPKYRNEETLRDLYKKLGNGKPVDYPIVTRDNKGNMTVFSGNTRMDIAFQMKINPKVVVIDI